MARMSVVMPIVVINVIVYVIQLTVPGFTESFVLQRGDLFTAPWTILTSMFMHGGPGHLLINMYVLFIFGGLIEQKIGTRKFLYLYFAAGILAAIFSQFVYNAALGASGAIMGIIGMVIVLFPRLQILFMFVIPMPMWIAGIIFVILDLFGVFFPGDTANIAHLVGIATGLGYGFYLKKQSRRFHKKFRKKTYMNDDDIDDYLRRGRI